LRLSLLAVLFGWAATAHAAEVHDCADAETGAEFIAEPWRDNTRAFSQGDVRLILLDRIEPAAGAYHLMLLSPPFDDFGQPTCHVVSFAGEIGYPQMTLEGMTSGYDPARGLLFGVLVDVGLDVAEKRTLVLELNQATGELKAKEVQR